jgi:hypothetical protein
VAAVADLQRTGLQYGADALEAIAERSLTVGALKLPPKSVKQLGVSLPDLYKRLAEHTHQGVEQVKSELKHGTFDVEIGLQELTASITGGKVGEVAQSKLGIGDAFTDIKNDVRGMFEGIDTSPLADGIERARALFEDMFGDVDDSGKTFGQVVVDAVAEIEDRVVLFALKTKNEWWQAKHDIANAFDPKGVKSFEEKMKGVVLDVTTLATMAGQTYDFFEKMGHLALIIPRFIADNLNEDEREEKGDFSGLDWTPRKEKPHAQGGVVQPADGEMFASVAPGETIVPAGAINIPDFGSSGMGGAFGGGRGATHVTVEAGAVQVHAPSGTMATRDEMQQLSEQAVVDLVERIVAELGG